MNIDEVLNIPGTPLTDPTEAVTMQPITIEEPKEIDNAITLVDTKEKALLGSDEIQKAAEELAGERIRSDYFSEAAKIKQQNVKTSEEEFETETRRKRLKQQNAKLDLEHKYEMAMIKKNGKHYAMKDKRSKLEEKYGYLYKKDDKENLIDFSYSPLINTIRTFTRNMSRLDTTVKKILKWTFFIGVFVGAFFLLRHFGIIN